VAGPPEVQITGGSPDEDEAAAVRAAIVALWREDQARAAREAPADRWALAGRMEATGVGAWLLRARSAPSAWRISGRYASAESHITAGRGDAK
jgi:hypothetical protein